MYSQNTILLLILLLSLFSFLSAIKLPRNQNREFIEKSTSTPLPSGWKFSSFPSPETPITLHFCFKQPNPKTLLAKFESVSDPSSLEYRKFLTREQIRDLVSPSHTSIDTLTTYLSNFEVLETHLSYTQDTLDVILPLSEAERLLQVKFTTFQHVTGLKIIRSLDPYTLPSPVASQISFIGGISHFPKIKTTKRINSPKRAQENLQATPSTITTLFDIPSGLKGTNTSNLQAVAQFLEQYYSPSDLSHFQTLYNLPSQKVSKVIGDNDPSNPGIEASLDIEYILAVAPGVPTWFFYTAGRNEYQQEPFLQWATSLNGMTEVPSVISVSYGDVESTLSKAYTDKIDTEFMKLGLRGISILFASGDDGVGCNDDCSAFAPNYPASSPFVTAVGGVVDNGNKNVEADVISSGGFSNSYAMPSYQQEAVKSYLNGNDLPPAKYFNASSRAMPDIAAVSENVMIIWQGSEMPVGGTSCAAPAAAGLFALINDALLNKGEPTLGFLNPLLYKLQQSNPDVFLDVTTGQNEAGCCGSGFKAEKGWDAVTGLGVPQFTPMLKAITQ